MVGIGSDVDLYLLDPHLQSKYQDKYPKVWEKLTKKHNITAGIYLIDTLNQFTDTTQWFFPMYGILNYLISEENICAGLVINTVETYVHQPDVDVDQHFFTLVIEVRRFKLFSVTYLDSLPKCEHVKKVKIALQRTIPLIEKHINTGLIHETMVGIMALPLLRTSNVLPSSECDQSK